ncbi:MAG: sulfatase-like hydrolase/transferase [Bryobacteraceae bacterium]
MRRREFLSLGAAAALAPARKPNVIVILADDLGYADVGFQGCKDIPTPNLDRLAASGVRFTNACVSHPFCSPTRAGLMTGRYQQRFGHENNPRYDPNDRVAGLPLKEITFPQVMKTAGYRTGIVGKWHLGATPEFHPMRRGFDEMFGFIGGGHDYYKAEMEGNPREYLIPIERDGKPVVERAHLTDAFSREASAFVRRHRGDPFFLYLAYNAPHTPLQPEEKWLARVKHIEDETRRKYAAMICGVDDGVGRLMSTLRETGLERDTLVFFLSDNGGPVAVTHSSNHPLRGAKGQVYEGGVRVPFVMRWTGTLPAGKVYSQQAISLDILPTAAAVAGAQTPGIDGVNLLPHLSGKSAAPPHERLFFRRGGGEGWAVKESRYKLVKETGGEPQLFDLEKDIGETTDIGAAQPAVRDRLLRAYQQWNRELIPPLFESPRPAQKKK